MEFSHLEGEQAWHDPPSIISHHTRFGEEHQGEFTAGHDMGPILGGSKDPFWGVSNKQQMYRDFLDGSGAIS